MNVDDVIDEAERPAVFTRHHQFSSRAEPDLGIFQVPTTPISSKNEDTVTLTLPTNLTEGPVTMQSYGRQTSID